jgi:hypothetical protein
MSPDQGASLDFTMSVRDRCIENGMAQRDLRSSAFRSTRSLRSNKKDRSITRADL